MLCILKSFPPYCSMKHKKAQLPQLNLFEEFVPVEELQAGDHLRLAPQSPNVYYVVEQFNDQNPETKIKLVKSTNIYFVKHGRKVLKVNHHA